MGAKDAQEKAKQAKEKAKEKAKLAKLAKKAKLAQPATVACTSATSSSSSSSKATPPPLPLPSSSSSASSAGKGRTLIFLSDSEGEDEAEREDAEEDEGGESTEATTVTHQDYEAANFQAIVVSNFDALSSKRMPRASREAGQRIIDALLQRRFERKTELILIILRKDGSGRPSGRVADLVTGWYMKKPSQFGGRSWYQYVAPSKSCVGVSCRATYLFWCEPTSCWKIGPALDNLRARWARASCLSGRAAWTSFKEENLV